MAQTIPLLAIKGLSKSFPGVKALSNVDFQLQKEEIHSLMGENGAGKSTLIKLLTGVYQRDQGQILLEGKPIEPQSPHEAQQMGISTVYQEVNLIPTLSVAENIFLGRQPMKRGVIDWKRIRAGAEQALERLNLKIDVRQQLAAYSIAVQQMVAIARSVDLSAKILILDEPTSSLDKQEVKQLFAIMRQLKEEGIGIIFVSHFLDQIYEISDRITILRNGELVGEYKTKDLPRVELVAKMMGKELEEFKGAAKGKARENGAETVMEINNLGKRGVLFPFDIKLKKGEVLGLAGLLGSGRTELAKLLFGIIKPDLGKIEINGRKVVFNSPRRAIQYGFGFCPEDRKTSGIIEDLTVRENIILALQARRGWLKTLSRKTQEAIADQYIKALNIATPTANQKVKFLSGGNQQKVIVARWLAADPRFLILDEPTRGIDVGAKAEIQKLILALADTGMSILFISSELEEVVHSAHRVAVLRDRRKIAELVGEAINVQTIMETIAEG